MDHWHAEVLTPGVGISNMLYERVEGRDKNSEEGMEGGIERVRDEIDG